MSFNKVLTTIIRILKNQNEQISDIYDLRPEVEVASDATKALVAALINQKLKKAIIEFEGDTINIGVKMGGLIDEVLYLYPRGDKFCVLDEVPFAGLSEETDAEKFNITNLEKAGGKYSPWKLTIDYSADKTLNDSFNGQLGLFRKNTDGSFVLDHSIGLTVDDS